MRRDTPIPSYRMRTRSWQSSRYTWLHMCSSELEGLLFIKPCPRATGRRLREGAKQSQNGKCRYRPKARSTATKRLSQSQDHTHAVALRRRPLKRLQKSSRSVSKNECRCRCDETLPRYRWRRNIGNNGCLRDEPRCIHDVGPSVICRVRMEAERRVCH